MIEKSMNLASRMTFTPKELKLMRIGHNLKACAGSRGGRRGEGVASGARVAKEGRLLPPVELELGGGTGSLF